MRKFDTKVQYLKYKVLREVARLAFEDLSLIHIWAINGDIYTIRIKHGQHIQRDIPEPVSYTHLDVYKRQAWALACWPHP